jgi:hypothetical protein
VSGARSRRRHGRHQALRALEHVPARVRPAGQPGSDTRGGCWKGRLLNGFWFQDSKDYAQNVLSMRARKRCRAANRREPPPSPLSLSNLRVARILTSAFLTLVAIGSPFPHPERPATGASVARGQPSHRLKMGISHLWPSTNLSCPNPVGLSKFRQTGGSGGRGGILDRLYYDSACADPE